MNSSTQNETVSNPTDGETEDSSSIESAIAVSSDPEVQASVSPEQDSGAATKTEIQVPQESSSTSEAATENRESPESDTKASEPTTSSESESETEASSKSSDEDQSEIDPKEIVKELKDLRNYLRTSLGKGQLRECISLYEKSQAKIKKLSDLNYESKKLTKLKKHIAACQQELKELKDWRHWGIEQSRLNLIEKMEALTKFEGDPMELHSEIKKLKKLWDSWIRSGDFPNRVMRERYANAYQEAFKPCKAHFKKQKKQRKTNKKIRNKICRKLEEFFELIDWDAPDWAAINQKIRKSRKSWTEAVPLNKKDWDATNARFDAIIAKFKPHLDQERKRGVEFRRKLIVEAEALDSAPVRDATERVKQLQRDWKTVIIRDKKKVEKELWKKFHTACDRQFQRRAEIQNEFKAKRKESENTRQKLIDELVELNKLPLGEKAKSASRVAGIQRKYSEATKNAGKYKNSLDNQFRREVTKFRNAQRELKRIEKEAALSVLENKAKLCEEIELGAIKGEFESDIDGFIRRWEKIEDSCGEFEDAIRNRFDFACNLHQRASDGCTTQWATNLEAKQSICLQLEIISKIESPPEFAQDRMQANIERLQSAMVSQDANTNTEAEMSGLMVKYWLTGAVPEHAHDSLVKRFDRIRSELTKIS